MEWLPWGWAMAGLVMILAEFAVPGLVIAFFGVGALLTAGLTAIIPGLISSVPLQILLWLGGSVGTLLGLRRHAAKLFKGKATRGTEGEDEYTGRTVEVVEEVRAGKPGRVRFQGTTWTAITYDQPLAVGDMAEIMKSENLTLVVTKPLLDDVSSSRS